MSYNLNSPLVQQMFTQNPAVPQGAGGYYGPHPQTVTQTIPSSAYSLVDMSPYPTPAQMSNQYNAYPTPPQTTQYEAYSKAASSNNEGMRQFCDSTEVTFTPKPEPPKPPMQPATQPQRSAVGYAPPITFNNPTQYYPPINQQPQPPQPGVPLNSWTDMSNGKITLGQIPMPVLQLGGAMAPGAGGGMYHDMNQPVPLPPGYSNPYLGQGPYGAVQPGFGPAFSPVTRQYEPDGNTGLDYYLANYHNRPINPHDINDPRNSALFSQTVVDRALAYRYADREDREAMDNGFDSAITMMEHNITVMAKLAIVAAKGSGHPENVEEIKRCAKAEYDQFVEGRNKRIEANKERMNPFSAFANNFGKEDKDAFHPHCTIVRRHKDGTADVVAECNNPEIPGSQVKAVSVRESYALVDTIEKARTNRVQFLAQREAALAQRYASAPERKLDKVENVVDAFNEMNYLMIMDKFDELAYQQRERRKGKIDPVDYRIELRLSECANAAERAYMRKVLQEQREKRETEERKKKRAAEEGGYQYQPTEIMPMDEIMSIPFDRNEIFSQAADGGLNISLPPRVGDQIAQMHQTPYQKSMQRARMEFFRRAGEGR